jgi:hypothetical protein
MNFKPGDIVEYSYKDSLLNTKPNTKGRVATSEEARNVGYPDYIYGEQLVAYWDDENGGINSANIFNCILVKRITKERQLPNWW